MAFINKSLSSSDNSTMIPNEFIDTYMVDSSPLFVMIYIFSIRHFLHNNNMTIKEIAEKLGVFQSEVKKAWEYWAEKGIVKIHNSIEDLGEDMLLEFLPFNDLSINNDLNKDIKVNMAIQPAYTSEEIDIYMERSLEIRQLFKKAEDVLAKPLTYNELNMLLTFFEWYALPIDVIGVMLEYCVSIDKKGKNYLEVVARDWSENEINTVEKAKEYINSFSGYGKIMKAFGIGGKSPNKKQISFIKKWIEEYKLPMEIIIEGCEDAFLQTGKAQFEYADKILKDWSDKQVKTLEDADKARLEFKEKNIIKENKKVSKTTTNSSKNRFINYKQREWDYDQIEKLAQEKL